VVRRRRQGEVDRLDGRPPCWPHAAARGVAHGRSEGCGDVPVHRDGHRQSRAHGESYGRDLGCAEPATSSAARPRSESRTQVSGSVEGDRWYRSEGSGRSSVGACRAACVSSPRWACWWEDRQCRACIASPSRREDRLDVKTKTTFTIVVQPSSSRT
jgi:hypothetical protein